MNRLIAICMATLILPACGRSQSYYDAHPSARETTLAECQSGKMRGDDCKAAAASAAATRHQDAEQAFKSMSENK